MYKNVKNMEDLLQNDSKNDLSTRRKTEEYKNNSNDVTLFGRAVEAIETIQKELAEQTENHKTAKKNLSNAIKNKKIKHQRKLKNLQQNIKNLENEIKNVNKTKYALMEDEKSAKAYLANEQRNKAKEEAHLSHLKQQMQLQRERTETLENKASTSGSEAAVESAEAITTITPVVRQRTKKPRAKVVRQRPNAINVIISVFHHDLHTVLLIFGFINFEKFIIFLFQHTKKFSNCFS